MSTLENIRELQISFRNSFEIISGKFWRAEIELFRSDVDEDWNNFILHVAMAL